MTRLAEIIGCGGRSISLEKMQPMPMAPLKELQHAKTWLALHDGWVAGVGSVGAAEAAMARERTARMDWNCMLVVVKVGRRNWIIGDGRWGRRLLFVCEVVDVGADEKVRRRGLRAFL